MVTHLLTTIDNDKDPNVDFDAWYAEDIRLSVLKGRRDCCSLLASLTLDSPNFSELDNELARERAIDIIVSDPFINPLHEYIRIKET